jgi:hypothetical protein
MQPSLKRILRSVPQFSPAFGAKQIKYVAAIVCHGMSCDSAKHLVCQDLVTCENPLFKTEYDVVFTSKYGDTSEVHGNSHLVAKYLCEKMKTRKNGSGAEFMEILDSTVDRGAYINANGISVGLAGALGKNTILTQKDIETDVADLELFVEGTHSPYDGVNDNDNDSIFLFEIDPTNHCDNVRDHNILSIDPHELFGRRPGLAYVAQAAHNLQSFIEPTSAQLMYNPTTGYGWSDVTHRLKEFKDDPDPDRSIVRLSDILGKKGIFPEGTVVVTYVCRSTLIDDLCVETPVRTDYRSVHSTPMAQTPMAQTPTARMTFAALDLSTPRSGATPIASGATPMSGTPMSGTPMIGTPMIGTPMSGTPMIGTPTSPFHWSDFDNVPSNKSGSSWFNNMSNDNSMSNDNGMSNGGTIKKKSKRKKTLKKRRN